MILALRTIYRKHQNEHENAIDILNENGVGYKTLNMHNHRNLKTSKRKNTRIQKSVKPLTKIK